MTTELADAQAAAALYRSLGWYPIPLVPKSKACRDKDWKEHVYGEEEFEASSNVGIRLVRDSDQRSVKLVGVDLDAPECVEIAWAFLPPSDAAWGRASKRVSQVLYVSPFEKEVVYKDVKTGTTLIEIRVDHQSMAPPSIHPSGEQLHWLGDGPIKAPEVDHKVLRKAVQMIATGALVGRYYPNSGSRHDWCLALAGALKLFGLLEEEVVLLVQEGAKAQGGDTKIKDRLQEIHTTFARADDEPVAGMNKLVDILGEETGKPFVESLRKIWAERSPFRMIEGGKGKTSKISANDQANIRRALEKLEVKLWSDEFAHRIMIQERGEAPKRIDDDIMDRLWLEVDRQFHFRPTYEFFEKIVRNAAKATPVHPVTDWLSTLKWDGVPRLDRWIVDLAGAKDLEFNRAVSAIVLIAAVRRVRQPGCKFDELLVLESKQGQNKSTALRNLCPEENWFADDLPLGVDAKIVIERTSGKWLIEAQELMNMRKAQVEQLKSFLSRQTDGPVRMAYDRNSREVDRQFVIVGTTNSSHYLKDPSGNRRFWPISVESFDIKRLREIREQLWAEAAHREEKGESIRLAPKLYGSATIQQQLRREIHPWEEPVEELIASYDSTDKQRISFEEIWDVLRVPMERRDAKAMGVITDIMEARDFRRMTVRRGEKVLKGWGRDMVNGEWRPGGWDKT